MWLAWANHVLMASASGSVAVPTEPFWKFGSASTEYRASLSISSNCGQLGGSRTMCVSASKGSNLVHELVFMQRLLSLKTRVL